MMVAGLLVVIGVAVAGFIFGVRFHRRDLMTLAFLLSVGLFLSRFDQMLAFSVMERPLLGIHIYLASVALLLGILLGMRGVVLNRYRRYMYLLLAVWGFLALASGLIQAGLDGLVAAVQILCIAVPPLIVASQITDFYPRTLDGNRRLRLTVVLLAGLVTPLIMLMTAVFTDAIGAAMGWRTQIPGADAGLVRGWSPLGSTISSGGLVIVAYGICLHEFITTRRPIFVMVAILNIVAILVTLSRSVLLSFILFHVVYWLLWAKRQRSGRSLFLPAVIAATISALAVVQGVFTFERLVQTDDLSLHLRQSSAAAALHASLQEPLLGAGPGLLYKEIRTSWLLKMDGGFKQRFMLVGDQISAMEPHNLYLLIASEHGWLALLIFAAVMAIPLIACWRALARPRIAGLASLYIALWISLGVLMLSNSDPLLSAQFAFFFWLLAFLGLHAAGLAHEHQGS